MSRVFLVAGAVLASVLMVSAASAQNKSPKPAFPAQWDALVDEFFNDAYFKYHLTDGTAAGFHQYDPLLEDYSRAGVESETEALKIYKTKLEHFNQQQLNVEQHDDWQLMLNYINSRLLTLEDLACGRRIPTVTPATLAIVFS